MNQQFSQIGGPVINETPALKPEFIRLPKPGKLCPHTGLSRSKLNELILPCETNSGKPPVKSISLRKRGQVRGVRLIVFDSLLAYLSSFSTRSKLAR
jgi:hypothetical protein